MFENLILCISVLSQHQIMPDLEGWYNVAMAIYLRLHARCAPTRSRRYNVCDFPLFSLAPTCTPFSYNVTREPAQTSSREPTRRSTRATGNSTRATRISNPSSVRAVSSDKAALTRNVRADRKKIKRLAKGSLDDAPMLQLRGRLISARMTSLTNRSAKEKDNGAKIST